MKTGVLEIVSLGFVLVCGLSCGGSGGGGHGGRSGTAGQQGAAGKQGAGGASAAGGVGGGAGQGIAGRAGASGGGASGIAGAGGTGGHGAGGGTGRAKDAGSDRVPSDAGRDGARTDGSAPACSIGVDGGTVPCTTMLAGNVFHDFFCALKAGDGEITCWGPSLGAMDIAADAPIWTNHPLNLVRFAADLDFGYPQLASFCGVDTAGRGTCWDKNGSADLGDGVVSVVHSEDGSCILETDGTIACSSAGAESTSPGVIAPAAGFRYTKVALSLHDAAGLDDTGTPHYRTEVFPSGAYVDLALAGVASLGLVRDDGAVLTFALGLPELPPPTVHPGSFTRVALDESSRACAIDRSGAIACWQLGPPDAAQPLTPPTGSFTEIIGGTDDFCALRATGTTACWGDREIDVPAGW